MFYFENAQNNIQIPLPGLPFTPFPLTPPPLHVKIPPSCSALYTMYIHIHKSMRESTYNSLIVNGDSKTHLVKFKT